MLYRYARDRLGMSVEGARDAQKSATWMVESFPGHDFPPEILAMRGRGSYARKLAYARKELA
jgi:hypothetical protein